MKFATLATVSMLALSTEALRLEHQSRVNADVSTEVKLQQLARMGEQMDEIEQEIEDLDWNLRGWWNDNVVNKAKDHVKSITGSHDLWNGVASLFHRK